MPTKELIPARRLGRKGKPEPRWREKQKRWELRLIVQSGGRRHRKSIYGRTRQECLDNAKPYKNARSNGRDVAGLELPLSTIIDRWLTAIEPPNPTKRAPAGLVTKPGSTDGPRSRTI